MRIRTRRLLVALASSALLFGTATGCKEKSPAEKMKDAIEDAADDIGDAASDAADDIGDAAEDAKEKAKEALE